jgi:hypothetical protein
MCPESTHKRPVPVVVEIWGYCARDRREAEAAARWWATWRGLEVAEVHTRPDPHPSARDASALEQEAAYDRTWAVLRLGTRVCR